MCVTKPFNCVSEILFPNQNLRGLFPSWILNFFSTLCRSFFSSSIDDVIFRYSLFSLEKNSLNEMKTTTTTTTTTTTIATTTLKTTDETWYEGPWWCARNWNMLVVMHNMNIFISPNYLNTLDTKLCRLAIRVFELIASF